MEEKWWSKFQTKTTEDEKATQNEYLSIDDIKEVVSEELHDKFEDAMNVGKKTSDDVIHWASDTLDKQPEMKEAFETAKEKATDMKQWAQETINKPEVQDAIHAVKDKTGEAFDAGSRVFQDVKTWTNQTLDKPEIQDAFSNAKDLMYDTKNESKQIFEDMKTWTKQTMEKPEVQETIYVVKEKANEAVDASKQFLNQSKEWANDIRYSSEVKATISNVKTMSKDVADDVKIGFERIVSDPSIQKNVDSLKSNVNNFKNKVNHGYDELRDSSELKEELKELGRTAMSFGKQGARVVVATVEEIRTNETVIATVEKGKEITLDLVARGIGAFKSMMDKKKEQAQYESSWERAEQESFKNKKNDYFDESQQMSQKESNYSTEEVYRGIDDTYEEK